MSARRLDRRAPGRKRRPPGGERRRRTWPWLLLLAALLLTAGVIFALRAQPPVREPPPRAAPAVVWAVGDGPGDGSDGDPEAVARMIEEDRPHLLLYLGDIYEDGTAEEYEEAYAGAWGRLAPITAPTPGNHEWDEREEGYDPFWERHGVTTSPHYYSLWLGGWQIISLNSEQDASEDSPQYRWLRDQVRAPGTCRLAFWHSSRYSAGTRHGDDEDMDPVWDALTGRARLVVTAHDHAMQRLAPREGITPLVSGAGGRSHYPVEGDYPGLEWANDTDYGALRIELRRGRADFAFMAVDGRQLDSGSVRCTPVRRRD